MPGLHHAIVFLLSAFSLARFETIGAIGNAVSCHGVEQLLVETSPVHYVTFALNCNQRLERLQCLDRSLEADRSWFNVVFAGGLGDDGADEIVGQDVRLDLLSHQLRRLAAQDVHLHRLFERPQIELHVPPGMMEFSEVACGMKPGSARPASKEIRPSS